MSETCNGCGSAVTGRVCHFCGTITRSLESAASEAEAIAELHAAITASKDDETRARLLKNGPLPSDRDVLIDAGLRASQLLDPSTYADDTPKAAIARVQAVVMKLRVIGDSDAVTQRAVTELEQGLARYQVGAEKESAEGSRAVAVVAFFFLALVGGIGFLIWWLAA